MPRSFNPSQAALQVFARANALGIADVIETARIAALIVGGEVYAYNAEVSALARKVEEATKKV